jgi:hypothetical protein
MEEAPKLALKQPSLMDLAAPIAKQVEIVEVVLSSARLSRNLCESDEVLRIAQSVSVRSAVDEIKPAIGDPWHQITALVTCKLSGTKENETTNEIPPDGTGLEIEAEFALRYRLTQQGVHDSNSVDAFAKMNGVYNAWPYWREFVQSTVARMGLPPLVVGVLTHQSLVKLFPVEAPRPPAAAESSTLASEQPTAQ